jgi:ketosteroid isomerase-like protein
MTPEQLITDMNQAWSDGRLDDLDTYYHPDALLLPPDAGEPIQGRAGIVSTYRDFAAMTQLHSFTPQACDCYTIGDNTAIHMRFEVDYSMEDSRYLESGLEVYLLNDTPQIIWRYQTVLSTRTLA